MLKRKACCREWWYTSRCGTRKTEWPAVNSINAYKNTGPERIVFGLKIILAKIKLLGRWLLPSLKLNVAAPREDPG